MPPPPPGAAFGAPPPPPPGAVPPGYAVPGPVPPGYAVPGAPGSSPRGRGRRVLVVAGILAAGLIGLVVLGLLTNPPEDDDETGILDRLPDIIGGGSAPDLAIGDCFDDHTDVPFTPDTTMVEAQVREVPCSGTHDAEVYHLFDHPARPDTSYPGDAAMFQFAFEGCVAEFERFVGAPYDTSALDVYFLVPTPAAFSRLDERQVICAVVNLDGTPLDGGTERGSGR